MNTGSNALSRRSKVQPGIEGFAAKASLLAGLWLILSMILVSGAGAAEWEWSTPGDTEGWTAGNATSAVASSGGDLVATYHGADEPRICPQPTWGSTPTACPMARTTGTAMGPATIRSSLRSGLACWRWRLVCGGFWAAVFTQKCLQKRMDLVKVTVPATFGSVSLDTRNSAGAGHL